MPKRYRAPKLKEGELRMYYGKVDGDIDVVYAWQGDSSMRRDTRLLHHFLGSERPDPFAKPIFSKMDPSLLKELENRGYDITTIKFSIMKKQPAEAA